MESAIKKNRSFQLRNSQDMTMVTKLLTFIVCLPPRSKFVTGLSVKQKSIWYGPEVDNQLQNIKTKMCTQCVCVCV